MLNPEDVQKKIEAARKNEKPWVEARMSRLAALDPDATLPPVTAKVVAPYLRDKAIDTKAWLDFGHL